MCVPVCAYVSPWWTTPKRVEINPSFVRNLVGHKNPSSDICGNVVAHDLDLLPERKDSNLAILKDQT